MLEAAVPSPNTFPAEEPMGLLNEGFEPNDAVPPNAGEPPKEGGLPNTGALAKPPAERKEGNRFYKRVEQLVGMIYKKKKKKKRKK